MTKENGSKKRGLLGGRGHSGSKAPDDPFLFGCTGKQGYDTEEDAFEAACLRMNELPNPNKLDWLCFRVYECPHCHKFHLTKAFNGKEEV